MLIARFGGKRFGRLSENTDEIDETVFVDCSVRWTEIWSTDDDDDDELMLNVLRCHLTY